MTTVTRRASYYQGLSADYSRPEPVSAAKSAALLETAARVNSLCEPILPQIGPDYTIEQIEAENREWWPAHCEALRRGRADLLSGEYADNLVYLCADGPFYGRNAGTHREKNWWALLSQPGVTMSWPIVMFSGEHVYFEWKCVDDATGETTAKGSVTWVRRGHRGGCYLKCEQLTFYRDVYAPAA